MALADARNTSTAVEGAVEFGNETEAGDCVHSSNQDELHVGWDEPETDEPVEGVCE